MAIYQKVVKSAGVGPWLKKGVDFKDKEIITIANEGQEVQSNLGPGKQNVFLVKTASGKEGNLGFNQTSINHLIDAYGPDSLHWVGKRAKVWLILQSVSGEMKRVVYLTHPSAEIVEDDSGRVRWVIPNGKPVPKVAEAVDYPVEEINPDDIPF